MRYLSLLRRPVPLLLWIGQVASLAGDRLYSMAVLWLTLSLTGSTTATATVALTTALPQALVGLLGAGLIDRVQRVRLMIRLDLIRAFLLFLLPILFYLGHLRPWHLGVLGIVMGSLEALFEPALQATLPLTVTAEEFPGFAGLMDTPNRFARLLGPGLAGLLLSIMSPIHFFTLDGISFLISALALTLAGRRLSATAPTTPRPTRVTDLRLELREGRRQLTANRDVRLIFIGDAVGNLAFAAFNLGGLMLATQRLGTNVGGYGLLIGAYGLGSLGGNLMTGNLGQRLPFALLAKGGWAGIGLGFLALGMAPTLPWAIAATAFAGAFGSVAHVSRAVYVRQTVAPQHLGKVYSLLGLMTQLAFAAGTLLCGILLERLPAALVVGGAGVTMALSATLVVLAGRTRQRPVAA